MTLQVPWTTSGWRKVLWTTSGWRKVVKRITHVLETNNCLDWTLFLYLFFLNLFCFNISDFEWIHQPCFTCDLSSVTTYQPSVISFMDIRSIYAGNMCGLVGGHLYDGHPHVTSYTKWDDKANGRQNSSLVPLATVTTRHMHYCSLQSVGLRFVTSVFRSFIKLVILYKWLLLRVFCH